MKKASPFLKLTFLVINMAMVLSMLGQQFSHASFQGLGPGAPPAVVHLPNGDVVQAFIREVGTFEITLVKTNACDEIVWSKRVSTGTTVSSLLGMVAHENDIYLAAVFGPHRPDDALTLIKFNAAGVVHWSKELTGPPMYWYNLSINNRGYIFLNGNSSDPNTKANVIVKMAADGTVLWSNSYTQIQIWGMGVPDENGGYLKLAGRTAYLLDANGIPQWIESYNTGYQSSVEPLATADGFIIFSGTTAQNHSQAFKINLNGAIQWSSSRFTQSNFSEATLLQNQEILIASNGAGPNFDQTQLLWLKAANGSTLKNKWIHPNTQPTGHTTVSQNSLGHLFLHSQLSTASATSVDYLHIKPNVDGSNVCQWQNGNTAITANPIQENGSMALPQAQAVTFSQLPITVSLQNTVVALNKGCSNIPKPKGLGLGNDTTLCPGQTLHLSPAPQIDGNYLWNNGQQTKTLEVTQAGKYWLQVDQTCGLLIYSDTVKVDFHESSSLEIKADQFEYNLGETISLTLKNDPDTTVFWETSSGNTNRGSAWNLDLERPGILKVRACFYTPEQCLVCDSLEINVTAPELILPNAFTPNNDGLNETFGPAEGALAFYQLFIKDRFGKTLAQLTNSQWNGQHKGEVVNNGVYVYELRYQIYTDEPMQIKRGKFTLLR